MEDLCFRGGPDSGVAAAVGPNDPARRASRVLGVRVSRWLARSQARNGDVNWWVHRRWLSKVLRVENRGRFRRWHGSRGMVAVEAGFPEERSDVALTETHSGFVLKAHAIVVIGRCLDRPHDGSGAIAVKHDLALAQM